MHISRLSNDLMEISIGTYDHILSCTLSRVGPGLCLKFPECNTWQSINHNSSFPFLPIVSSSQILICTITDTSLSPSSSSFLSFFSSVFCTCCLLTVSTLREWLLSWLKKIILILGCHLVTEALQIF